MLKFFGFTNNITFIIYYKNKYILLKSIQYIQSVQKSLFKQQELSVKPPSLAPPISSAFAPLSSLWVGSAK